MQFFDKVVDVPVVLCEGVPQVLFIDGYDVPVIMQRRHVATVKVPQIQFIAGVSGHSSLATVGYAQCKLCSFQPGFRI